MLSQIKTNWKMKTSTFYRIALLLLGITFLGIYSCDQETKITPGEPGVSVLLVDTDHARGKVDKDIYGHFLEHINHSVVDGLFAEQIRGRGFEGDDFETYWENYSENGEVQIVNVEFENGQKSLLLKVNQGEAGIRQGRIYIEQGYDYNGSVWLKPKNGNVDVKLLLKDSQGKLLKEISLETSGKDWQEVNYSFSSPKTDEQAAIEIQAEGQGSILVDYISMMRADVRNNGMLRPDLVNALKDLEPPFIRWPGGAFASIYKWKDGIGPHVSRTYHPNKIWGGYSDYYGFGTDEFMTLCKKLDTEPMVVLPATSTDSADVQYAMDWVHYLNDPSTTKWGQKRAENGHPEPYNVQYFQIDNEPMNHGFSPEHYAKIVNVYGSRLRKIAPEAEIIACGQKRSNDMIWSKIIIDMSGKNFDILGCHNYEYEEENFQTGIRRIENYLVKLREYIQYSEHPDTKLAVLEWSLCRSYDWRAGLHTAGSLISYESLSPKLKMTCPALLMRNVSDNPRWRAFIYHDHTSWFPGSGYVVENLFRDHYAEKLYASTSGTFSDIEDRSRFFDKISQMKPRDWTPGTVEAIATGSSDGEKIIIKAVNYQDQKNILLARLQGAKVPEEANVTVYRMKAGLKDKPSLENPDKIEPQKSTIPYQKDLTIGLNPYSVVVVEIAAE